MIEYEIEEHRKGIDTEEFRVVYTVEVDGKKKCGITPFSFGKVDAYQILGFDENNNPIPKWKHAIESHLRTIEKAMKTEIKPELKPILNKKIQVISETLTKDDDLQALIDLNYIGPELAKTLIDRFGNLSNVINASKDELIDIMGIGPKNVDKIMKELGKL